MLSGVFYGEGYLWVGGQEVRLFTQRLGKWDKHD